MTVNDALRLIAGFLYCFRYCLLTFFHPAWLLFTGFVALNLMQSAFTKWCPMIAILRKAGMKDG